MNQEERAVFEVGMNQPGEIASLASLLQPDIAVLLNVNPVHLGQFPSIEEIAKEKTSLADHLAHTDSRVVYNADDTLIRQFLRGKKGEHVSFGTAEHADLRIHDVELRGVRGIKMKLQWQKDTATLETGLCGLGNAYNVAAAVCVALLEGMNWNDIESVVRTLSPYNQRGVLLDLNGILVYDDSYNSNPKALELALSMLAATTGCKRKVAIIGDMLELGPDEIRFHSDAGKLAAQYGYDVLITAGPLSKHAADAATQKGMKHVYAANDSTEAASIAVEVLQDGDLALVKGSRGMKMETVVEKLRSR
jgi:UDP-N-acetylmuramoyl-tripeptide--D-alanyl-D-alanine ligase